ncbi:MAG: PH domain-containing protein [Nocardioidaceae bacterium]|nr:PH domain-containing protein [Nocardioidaceae bacterium]
MTYRPLGARVVSFASAGSLLVVLVVIGWALPPGVRSDFTVAQVGTLLVLLGGALAVLHGIGRTRVRTDAAGLHVVNGYRRHDLSWPEAVHVSIGRGAPWAVLDTNDGRVVQLMAIQRSDGPRAAAAVAQLRAELAAHTPRDP